MMKALNVIGAILLGTAAWAAFQRPATPPSDPWFQAVVLDAQRPVLVKFGAEWCGPCKHMDSLLEQSQGELSRQVKVVRIDIDQRPQLADHYGISSIPRVMLFQQGQLVASHGGFATGNDLQQWITQRIK